ncbi:MAG TPA: hypothetical protein VK081_05965, partial [Planctomycetota bacterium]|nr:hypothetical protein [Planctomycetota bacterium]
MNPLLRFLFENPIIVLVLVAWLMSGLASMAGKAARRAQQHQQQQRRRAAAELEGRLRGEPGHEQDVDLERRAAQQVQQERPREARPAIPQTAEDIARELRQMLGLDPEVPPRPPRVEPEGAREERAYAEEPRRAEPDTGDRVRPQFTPLHPHLRPTVRPTVRPKVQVVAEREHQVTRLRKAAQLEV